MNKTDNSCICGEGYSDGSCCGWKPEVKNDYLEANGIPFVECARHFKCKNYVLFEVETFCEDCIKDDVEFFATDLGRDVERSWLSSDFSDNTL